MSQTQQTKPRDFLSYFEMLVARNAKANRFLTDALPSIETQGRTSEGAQPDVSLTTLRAVDLGCGIGQETAVLLVRGWNVLAIDFCQEAVDALRARPEAAEYADHLEARVQSFADSDWAPANLVVALAALPYGPPDTFDEVWQKIKTSLLPGGYFVGNFFGSNHLEGATHFVRRSRAEVEAMLAGLDVVKFEEVDRGVGEGEEEIFYHYFEIIARRPLEK